VVLAIEKKQLERDEEIAQLSLFAEAHSAEIILTVQLLQSDAKYHQHAEEMNTLLHVFCTLEQKMTDLDMIYKDTNLLAALAGCLDDEDYRAALSDNIDQIYHENRGRLKEILEHLAKALFPFEYGGEKTPSVADYLFSPEASFEHRNDIWQYMQNVPHNFFVLRSRILARILQIKAEAVLLTDPPVSGQL